MQNIKYIALDFDGTILNTDGSISDRLINKLIELQEDGYKIVLCSGRSLSGIQWLANQIHLSKYNGYIIAYNGSQIYEYQDDKLINLQNLIFKKNEVEIITSAVINEVECLATYDSKIMGVNKKIPRMEKSAKVMGLDLDDNYLKETPKIILYDKENNIDKIKPRISQMLYSINPNINIFSSLSTLIEITPPNSSKGFALQKLSELKHIKKDRFICFGDGENDISMFEFCKYSVAMGNAIDEIKSISTHNTKTNNEDGVYWFLKDNL